jgi:hypothetical protein
MTEADRVAWVTARLMGRTIVENVSRDYGRGAMRITQEDGETHVDIATSSREWNEWVDNVRRNHKAGYCFYVNYDSRL